MFLKIFFNDSFDNAIIIIYNIKKYKLKEYNGYYGSCRVANECAGCTVCCTMI